jgi:hypothetical protein
MSLFGTMHSYDDVAGVGWLRPEDDSKLVSFKRSEQSWVHHVPLIGHRYRYDVRSARSGEGTRAFNLQLFELVRAVPR